MTIEQDETPLPIRALNKCGALWPRSEIRAVDLIDAAKRRAGLEDFGDGDFFEPLSRLLESSQAEARLNVFGKIALRADVLRTLRNRLLMQSDRCAFPEIGRQQIREPLFIVGLPRSGTTILHILLAADPENRAPLSWEVMEPSPPNGDKHRQRIRRASRNFSWLHWLAPALCRVHPVGPHLPQECVTLMSPSFLSDQYDTMFDVPAYRRWFLKQDLAPAYEFHRRFLQHLQFRQKGRRWVLKAPAHLFALPTLLSIYPDAIFVQTHRAPLESISSVASLITILRSLFSDAVDSRDIGREALRYWSETMRNFLVERDRLPTHRIVDLSYEEIRRDPIAAVRDLYENFGWPLSSEVEERMRKVLANRRGHQPDSHRYEPAHFGLEAADCAQRFADYCERFGLEGRPKVKRSGVAETDTVAER